MPSSEWSKLGKPGRKRTLRAFVDAGETVGLLAYVQGEPAAWCSLAPREQYVRLTRSRTLTAEANAVTWSLLCFVVRADLRRQGLASRLLAEAIDVARDAGADVIEAIPDHHAKDAPRCRGSVTMFERQGFRSVSTTSASFFPMSKRLRESAP